MVMMIIVTIDDISHSNDNDDDNDLSIALNINKGIDKNSKREKIEIITVIKVTQSLTEA